MNKAYTQRGRRPLGAAGKLLETAVISQGPDSVKEVFLLLLLTPHKSVVLLSNKAHEQVRVNKQY